ncbi:MAG: magnesium transporter [Ignavibacteriaceae bacterium]|nr:magnesium transporter [Ignavibacteriaceae bacterium]
MLELTEHQAWQARWVATQKLAEALPPEQAWPWLCQLAQDVERNVREGAAHGLADLLSRQPQLLSDYQAILTDSKTALKLKEAVLHSAVVLWRNNAYPLDLALNLLTAAASQPPSGPYRTIGSHLLALELKKSHPKAAQELQIAWAAAENIHLQHHAARANAHWNPNGALTPPGSQTTDSGILQGDQDWTTTADIPIPPDLLSQVIGQEKAVEVFKKYDRIAIPVTDSSGVLIGIVTVDDVLDVAEEEATEDIQKFGAVEALEEPYSTISVTEMIKKRAGWLSLLFIGESLTASAMSLFEAQISQVILLTLFIPLIISSGGNSGSQAATLVVRALSLGEISIKDWFFVVRREIATGLILGGILAALGFLKIALTQAVSGSYGEHWVLIALTVSFTLVGIVLWGTLIGSTFPLILKRIGFDPATSSAPFVATLVDVTGLIIYFSVAIMLLSGTLL